MVNTGIVYRERYPFKYGEDGKPVIDYSSQVEVIYNKDIGLSRESQKSTIVELSYGDEWTPELACSSPAYKQEYLDKISEEPNVKVDVTLNRGNATAFESHLKLTECNTLEDLVNYGNNYFNL